MKLKSLLISTFLVLQLPAYLPAYADLPPYEPGGVNPLDQKTEFINNHLIALTKIKVDNGIKKFLAVIPSVGSKKIIIYEVDPSTNELKESATLEENLHSPFYATFDPSGLHLYGMSGNRNFVSHYAFDPAYQKFVSDDLHKVQPQSKLTRSLFQTDCDDKHLFQFDYSRSLQFFPSGNKAYITCADKNGKLEVIGYRFDTKSGAFIQFDSSLSSGKTPGSKSGKNSLAEIANPTTILIDPEGKYLYVIDDKNTWYQFALNQNGKIESTQYSFETHVKKTVFVSFDPSGKNVYIIARDYGSVSIIEQYKFDPSSAKLEKVDVVTFPANEALKKARERVHATHIEFTPDGRYAYVLDRKNNLIYQYRVEAETGNLTPLKPATFTTCSVIRSLIFDPDPSSHFAYAAASNRKTLEVKNKACQPFRPDPFKLHVDRLVLDPATGQLSNFVPKS